VLVAPVAISDIDRIETWCHDHPNGAKAAARDRGGHLVDAVGNMRGSLDLSDLDIGLMGEGDFGGLRNHQVRFNPGIAQKL